MDQVFKGLGSFEQAIIVKVCQSHKVAVVPQYTHIKFAQKTLGKKQGNEEVSPLSGLNFMEHCTFFESSTGKTSLVILRSMAAPSSREVGEMDIFNWTKQILKGRVKGILKLMVS